MNNVLNLNYNEKCHILCLLGLLKIYSKSDRNLFIPFTQNHMEKQIATAIPQISPRYNLVSEAYDILPQITQFKGFSHTAIVMVIAI